MEAVDVILLLVLAALVGLAGSYIYRARRRGQKCVGCPHSGTCPHCQTKK